MTGVDQLIASRRGITPARAEPGVVLCEGDPAHGSRSSLLEGLAAVTDFDRTTAVIPVEARPGEFLVDLNAGWSSLVGVHGGYLCALAVRGAESMASGRVVRTISTRFLRSGRVGPAELSVREVRRGRSITTMVAELAQNQKVLSISRLTLMTERSGLDWSEPRPVDPPAPYSAPFSPPAHLATAAAWPGATLTLTLPPTPRRSPRQCPDRSRSSSRQFELRFDPERMPCTGDRAHLAGYVRPLEPRPVDAAWLAMAVDCFPPPAFARTEPPTGAMSIDRTVDIHRSGLCLGEGAWLAGSFEIDDSTRGVAVEHACITRLDGTVLAESFQTRQTAQR
jgi:acyl-CoA thioesterase